MEHITHAERARLLTCTCIKGELETLQSKVNAHNYGIYQLDDLKCKLALENELKRREWQ